MSRTSYLRRPLTALLMGAALAASVLMAVVVLASPAWAATYTVTNNADSGTGSLRQAIIDANATTGVADTINFNLGSPATITLASQLPVITDSAGLSINGGSANITVSGNFAVRVFEVGSGAKLTLNKLTVANGRSSPSCSFCDYFGSGGGIYNAGTLTVSNSTLSGNGAVICEGGGGISNSGLNSTATLKNTIVANSSFGGNCAGTITNGGYNLDSGTSCGFTTENNSLSSTDPMLGALASNGGTTATHALLAGSPAIDKGNSFGATTDQRGVARPQGAAPDIGSFEVDTIKPKVTSTVPLAGNGIAPSANVTATFSEAMDATDADGSPNTITATTFKLVRLNADGTTTRVTAAVSYATATKKAILNPSSNLSSGQSYKATVTTGTQDLAGNALDQNPNIANNQPKSWKFTVQ